MAYRCCLSRNDVREKFTAVIVIVRLYANCIQARVHEFKKMDKQTCRFRKKYCKLFEEVSVFSITATLHTAIFFYI